MAIDKLIELAGTQSALAKAVGLKPGHIYYWVKSGRVPSDHVLAVCEAVGWQVTPHELRPDVYPHRDDGMPVGRRGAA